MVNTHRRKVNNARKASLYYYSDGSDQSGGTPSLVPLSWGVYLIPTDGGPIRDASSGDAQPGDVILTFGRDGVFAHPVVSVAKEPDR